MVRAVQLMDAGPITKSKRRETIKTDRILFRSTPGSAMIGLGSEQRQMVRLKGVR